VIPPNQLTADSPRISRLGREIGDVPFRASYFTSQLKAFLADQIRALRGDQSQAEFGRIIGKPQSVVSRLENEAYGQLSLQTLIDIANKLDIALLVRFVDWPTFLRFTEDYSSEAFAPAPFSQQQIDALVREEEARAKANKLMDMFRPMEQRQESSAQDSPSPPSSAELVWIDSQRKPQPPQLENGNGRLRAMR